MPSLFENLHMHLVEWSEALSQFALWFFAPFVFVLLIMAYRFHYPDEDEPFFGPTARKIALQTGKISILFGTIIGFFIQAGSSSVYTLLWIPVFGIGSAFLGPAVTIFRLYLEIARRKAREQKQ